MKAGDLIANRFVLVHLAGAGGMGEVYQATDRITGQKVALKTIHGKPVHDDRFAREALVLSELRHPGIVGYVTHGVTSSGYPYLVMDWLDGIDLEEHLKIRGALPLEDAVWIASRTADALGAAHERGIVHRDIKPSNLFLPLGLTDAVRILDFGVARLGQSASTQTGMIIGTPGYMAPEQARGEAEVDARADVFSLGCVLFECLTGRAAFVAEHVMALLAKILLEEVPRVSELRDDVIPALDRLVARMLSKDPAQRPENGRAVTEALNRLADTGTLRPAPREAASSSLTRGEQRLLCVVTVGVPLGEAVRAAMAQTMTPDQMGGDDDPARTIAEAHGGRFERLADGSRVVTLTGRGTATDQVARAARCALTLRQRHPDAQMALSTGRGVVTGPMPVGEVIETSVKLLKAAQLAREADQSLPANGLPIRVDEVTAGLLDVRFEVLGDDHGLCLVGEREIGEGARTLLGQATPCVGRDVELSTLQAVLEECSDEPLAHAVLVTSPAGGGKSRLRHEFLNRVQTTDSGLEIWLARGDPLSAGSPFGLIAQILRRTAGLLDGESLEARERNLRARVARHVPASEVDRLVDFLGELAGLPWPDDRSVQLRAARQNAQLKGDQMRRAWEDFVEAECAAHPVLVVLEDLHWGDVPTVSFVDSVLRRLADAPLMVLALARPEIHHQFPKLWQTRAVTHISLGPLSRRAGTKLVKSVLGDDVAPDLCARILERADGNAFYLEELIRSVAEGNADELPETVLAMIQARLEALPPEARRLLRAASVFGQSFTKRGLIALLGALDRKDLEHRLEQLVEQELVARHTGASPLGEAGLLFRHALVREAAYGMLTAEDIRTGHRLAGEFLEQGGETDAMVLAEHFARGEEPSRAIAWYRRAAEQALEGNDLDGAIERAELGVALGAEGEDGAALRLVQAHGYSWRGEQERGEQYALEVMAWADAGTRAWCEALGIAAVAAGRLGHAERLRELASKLRAALRPGRPETAQAAAITRVAQRLLLAGEYELADALLDDLPVDELALSRDPHLAAQVCQVQAQRANFAGDSEEKLRAYHAAARALENVGDLRLLCSIRSNLGDACTDLGCYTLAEHTLREARGLAQRLGLPGTAALAAHNLGLVLARQNKADEGRRIELSAVEEYVRLGNPRMEGASRIYMSLIAGSVGDHIDAERQARAAVDVLDSTPPLRCFALGALARALVDKGEPAAALDAAEEAKSLLDSLEQVDAGEALVRLVHAETLDLAGQRPRAMIAISAAFERLEERGARIRDSELRRSFLYDVPEHARTLELAAAWGVMTECEPAC